MKKLILLIAALVILIFSGCTDGITYDPVKGYETLSKEFPDSTIINGDFPHKYYIKKPDGSVWYVELNYSEEIKLRRKLYD